MKSFQDLVDESSKHVAELMPWDLEEKLQQNTPPIILDIREPEEFADMHIKGSMNIARGILESACDYANQTDAPELVNARDKELVVVCGSGKRSALAAYTMLQMGYKNIMSLKTGIKGWNDYDLPLLNKQGEQVDPEEVDKFLEFKVIPQRYSE